MGVLTTLAMGASLMAGPMAALASGQADQGAEPQGAPEAKGSAAVHSGLVKTAAIGTFSFDQTYVSPTADVARLQGVAQVACGGANASSQVRSADWQLTVSGDVDNAFCATIGELVEDESTPQLMTCSCGGNPAGGRAIVNAFGGGSGAVDFGSFENFCLALIVLAVILWVKHATGGFLSASSILIGIIVGYIVAAIMGLVLPTTIVNADGVEVTKAWVLNWDKVADAAWFAIPSLMPIAPVFDIRAIAPVLVMFVVTAVETVGDISGVTQGGMNREATDKELSGGVMCDGLGSTFAAFFGVLPNTSFSQNVGLVAMTKMTNRKALACGAIFLILCGLCPKLGAVVSIMPQSVLGGAAVIMFASIVVSGIQLITREPLTPRNLSIVSVALGLGYGIGANSAVLAGAPQMVGLIFGGSGIVAAAAVAILLNIVLPKDEKTFQKDASI